MVLRFVIGVLFVWTGFQKLMLHYENFLYVVQSYEILGKNSTEFLYIPFLRASVGEALEITIAWALPWMEFVAGVFLILGLWIRPAAFVLYVLTLFFAVATGQALWRGLPVDQCGCFGEGLMIPLRMAFGLDLILLAALLILRKFSRESQPLSLDRCLEPEVPASVVPSLDKDRGKDMGV
jgi:uncharacterized membrane protein YphA (DoxX/SURF4 family)